MPKLDLSSVSSKIKEQVQDKDSKWKQRLLNRERDGLTATRREGGPKQVAADTLFCLCVDICFASC